MFIGFASKVMGHVRFGFAAGCEAGGYAPPAAAILFLGYALGLNAVEFEDGDDLTTRPLDTEPRAVATGS
jgi:hypothetical protein